MAMAPGKIKFLYSTSAVLLLHNCRRTLPPLHLPSQVSSTRLSLYRTLYPRQLSSSPVLFCTVSAVYPEAVAVASPSAAVHPWPEWEGFLEKLREKGYLDLASSAEAAAAGERDSGGRSSGSLDASKCYSRVKTACLGFARERPDLLRFLSNEDIKVVVESGCPDLLRKSVHSSKRLRAYLKLNEADVCSSCNLRNTCDRAYVVAMFHEGNGTADLVRLLLHFATAELSAKSTEEGPHITESVKESIKRLLSQLMELSDTKPDPDVLKALTQPPVVDKPPYERKVKKSNQLQNVEMKRGDWICTQCDFMNYARNRRCMKCKADGPKRVALASPEIKKGDWTCPQCQFMNFMKNLTCLKCQKPRPKQRLNPGEWDCPSCNYMNFSRNRSCLKCKSDRPIEEGSNPYKDDVWTRPNISHLEFLSPSG